MGGYNILKSFNAYEILKIGGCAVKDLLTSFSKSISKTERLELIIPTNIYLRTEVLVGYIKDKSGVEYDVSDFIMTIYLNFINDSIKRYNPEKIHKEITKSYGYNERVLIHHYDYREYVNKVDVGNSVINIRMGKEDSRSGHLLLQEYDLIYGNAPTLDELISKLWINFIESYKSGSEWKTLERIIRMLKDEFGGD